MEPRLSVDEARELMASHICENCSEMRSILIVVRPQAPKLKAPMLKPKVSMKNEMHMKRKDKKISFSFAHRVKIPTDIADEAKRIT
jgi:hypothetical protein